MNTAALTNSAVTGLLIDQGLRILGVHSYRELDLLFFVLNNGKVLQRNISASKLLRDASQAELDNVRLLGNGTGIHWPARDEDLSLKGLLLEEFAPKAVPA